MNVVGIIEKSDGGLWHFYTYILQSSIVIELETLDTDYQLFIALLSIMSVHAHKHISKVLSVNFPG